MCLVHFFFLGFAHSVSFFHSFTDFLFKAKQSTTKSKRYMQMQGKGEVTKDQAKQSQNPESDPVTVAVMWNNYCTVLHWRCYLNGTKDI